MLAMVMLLTSRNVPAPRTAVAPPSQSAAVAAATAARGALRLRGGDKRKRHAEESLGRIVRTRRGFYADRVYTEVEPQQSRRGEHSTVLRAITGRLGGKHALLLEHAAQAAAAAQQAQLDWELQHLSAELQRSGG